MNLKQKKAKDNSTYWRKKALELVTELTKNQPCAVCKSMALLTTNRTCGHHVVAKKISGYYATKLINLLPLCEQHHMFSNEIAAHSSYQPAQVRFVDWLKEFSPKKYELLYNYKKMQGKANYREDYEVLKKTLVTPPFGEDELYEIV